jgi:hypothetical protein
MSPSKILLPTNVFSPGGFARSPLLVFIPSSQHRLLKDNVRWPGTLRTTERNFSPHTTHI